VTIFLLILSRVFNVLSPLVLKYAVDAITCADGPCPPESTTYTYIGLYAGIKFLGDFVNNLREVTFANVSASAEVYIAQMVYGHIQNQSLSFHLSRETGKVVRLVSRGSQSFSQILRYMLFNIVPIFLELFFVLMLLLSLYPYEFFVVTIVSVMLYILATVLITEWRAKFFKSMSLKDSEYVQKATDSLLNFETVKYFNAEEHEEQRFLKALMVYKRENIRVANSLVVLNITQAFVIACGLSASLLLAYYEITNGLLKIGDFVMINALILQMYAPLNFLGTFWRFIRQAMVDVELIFELLEVKQEIVEPTNPLPANISQGEIVFKDVSFTYEKQPSEGREKKMVIERISFTVPAGKSVALVGSTGSGKSTIMRLLYRFYELDHGQILIDGIPIKQMRTKDLRSKIAIVPQDCVLFNDTMKYNIAYGGVNDERIKDLIDDQEKEEELMRHILPASKSAQIHDFVIEKPKQYDEKVGERGLKLSGGEKQRVAIARALLKQTPIMCFDEATSALDNETERQIQAAIEEVSKGCTTLMIAHRLTTVMNCDKIIVLRHGVIVEEGTHSELLRMEDGYYKRLWEKQNEKIEKEEKEKEEAEREEKEIEDLLIARK